MKRCTYACHSPEHFLLRRGFLAGTAGTLGGLGLIRPAAARALEQQGKRVLVIFLLGRRQPARNVGPQARHRHRRAVPDHRHERCPASTSANCCRTPPKLMHRLALVRGVNTAEDDHGRGAVIMHTGRRTGAGHDLPAPRLGLRQAARQRRQPAARLHPHHAARQRRRQRGDAAFLGPRFASVALDDGKAPANIDRPADLTAEADRAAPATSAPGPATASCSSRRTAQTEAYTHSLRPGRRAHDEEGTCSTRQRAGRAPRPLRPARLRPALPDGPPPARRRGHLRQGDAHQLRHAPRELRLPHRATRRVRPPVRHAARRPATSAACSTRTLVVVMSEFGRTPTINRNYGRDHWSRAWSVALAGCGIKGGVVVGKTNANGTAVTDRQVNGGHLFHTYLQALGLDPKKNCYVDQRPSRWPTRRRRHHGGPGVTGAPRAAVARVVAIIGSRSSDTVIARTTHAASLRCSWPTAHRWGGPPRSRVAGGAGAGRSAAGSRRCR